VVGADFGAGEGGREKLGHDLFCAPRIEPGLPFSIGTASALTRADRHHAAIHRRAQPAHVVRVDDGSTRGAKLFAVGIANMKAIEVAAQVFPTHEEFGSRILRRIDAAPATVRAEILKEVFFGQGPHLDRLALLDGFNLISDIDAGVADGVGDVQSIVTFIADEVGPYLPTAVQTGSYDLLTMQNTV
jgi:hypothetical protein